MWFGDCGSDGMKMVVECLSLEGRKVEGDGREDRGLGGVERMRREMVACNLDERWIWWREFDVAKDLRVERR